MFENMTGSVGLAMHEDRLARATMNMRLAEAKQGGQAREHVTHHGYREAVARTLRALATRIAPAVALPQGYTGATGR